MVWRKMGKIIVVALAAHQTPEPNLFSTRLQSCISFIRRLFHCHVPSVCSPSFCNETWYSKAFHAFLNWRSIENRRIMKISTEYTPIILVATVCIGLCKVQHLQSDYRWISHLRNILNMTQISQKIRTQRGVPDDGHVRPKRVAHPEIK